MATAMRTCLSSPTCCMHGELAGHAVLHDKGSFVSSVSTSTSVSFGAAPAKAHPQLVVKFPPRSSALNGDGRAHKEKKSSAKQQGMSQKTRAPERDAGLRKNVVAEYRDSSKGGEAGGAGVLDRELTLGHGGVLTTTTEDGAAATAAGSLNGASFAPEHAAGDTWLLPASPSGIEIDHVTEVELKENGFRSTRRTKLICTIGPACSDFEKLETLAMGGMNVARINMCHGTREWHRSVIRNVRKLNAEKGFCVALMMDTEGSEIHMGDLGGAASTKAEDGEEWTFTVRTFTDVVPERTLQVNYDGFAEDVRIGDEIVVDGGMVRFEVLDKIGPDVLCKCIDPGLLLPRANLTFWRGGRLVRERNAMLPTISSKDWIDIDFGIAEGVDFIAISFVKSADVIKHLKSYISARAPEGFIGVFAKIESSDSLKNLKEIIQVSDGAMVARGDLGAQIPLEHVPSVQQEVVTLCRHLNKPVIVASQLLESMIEYPTPTRAEVADISEAVRQRADALMLSGESAMGLYPEKALSVLRTVSLRIERWCREEKHHESMRLSEVSTVLTDRISEQICNSAAAMANKLGVEAIFVYTRRGHMATLLSRCRPDCPIFAFTESQKVRQHLNLQWGLIPFRLDFSDDMETNLRRTFALLKARGMMKSGDLVVAVSDVSNSDMLQSIQVRKIP